MLKYFINSSSNFLWIFSAMQLRAKFVIAGKTLTGCVTLFSKLIFKISAMFLAPAACFGTSSNAFLRSLCPNEICAICSVMFSEKTSSLSTFPYSRIQKAMWIFAIILSPNKLA